MRRLSAALAFAALCGAVAIAQRGRVSEAERLQRMSSRFAPTEIRVDLSKVSGANRKVLAKLVEASTIMDALFLRQVWVGNEAMRIELAQDQSPEGRARLHDFLINKGPWDRLDHDKPFVPGAPAKPAGANFYPEDASKADLEAWMKSLSEADRAKAAGFFTVIRRGTDKGLSIVPYSREYKSDLARAGALLREAAVLTDNASLKKFLVTRADAFVSNNY